ncbi:MAG TPA: bifunctional oligoribonuclease/PAP phosphatase NrnA [Verrucomicrobiae bacterium]|jgi:phosphoesterase RecJ-like protein|nr:bifunctional oligoribonuclease/PAP phosphatase NrnA [Verrucomicrobiae bacterium]
MKPHPKIIDRILEGISQHKTFCVVGHVRPDGDCIGSQLGLTLALRDQGKKVTCWNEDRVPTKLAFLDPEKIVQKPSGLKDFDCVIATDCASFERLGAAGVNLGKRKLFINIDHHASNTRYADLNWISDKEPSSGEIIYRLLKVANWPITPAIADCLFTAVSTDTGSFQYPSTRPSTYNVAGELVKRGANLAKICDEVYQSYPLSRARLLQHVYNSFRLQHDDQIAYFWLKKADFLRTGAETDDSEGLIDHIRAIEPVIIACVFEELEPDMTRISLRSKSEKVNVNEIAALFGGGGHRAAAGARIPGPPLATQRRVLTAVKKALDAAA